MTANPIRIVSLIVVWSLTSAVSVANPADSNVAAPPARRVLDKGLENGVLQMVDQHLPELKILLDQLRRNEPAQYDSAIRNLAKSSRRLQSAKKRGEEAFELEVQVVQAQSAINLLIAKLTVRDSAKNRRELKEATRRLHQAEIHRARHDLAVAEAKLQRMQNQVSAAERRLSERESSLESQIDKGFQTYLRKSGRK